MGLLELLEERVSVPVLDEPAPSPLALDHAVRAALRTPDHGQLRPWRFLVIQGESRRRLGELYMEAGRANNPDISEKELTKLGNMPLRAPMIVVGIARLRELPKVPKTEQRVSVGAAVMNMMLSLHAQGYGCMWRTGWLAYDRRVMDGLGLAEDEEIISFLYVGTPAGKVRQAPQLEPADFCREWPG